MNVREEYLVRLIIALETLVRHVQHHFPLPDPGEPYQSLTSSPIRSGTAAVGDTLAGPGAPPGETIQSATSASHTHHDPLARSPNLG